MPVPDARGELDASDSRRSPTEWVSFIDDADTTWLFDVTFLTSNWSCTFGSTCPGTEPDDNGARGCCAHGAYLVDQTERDMIVDVANRLTPELWHNFDAVATPDDLFETIDGETLTRRVDDACVFLNPRGFAGGHGCALHLGALEHGERPLDWKPTVCWQVPFRREYYDDASGTRTVAVRAWRRSDWGEGGEAFGWWCTEHLLPGSRGSEMWRHHQDELHELVDEGPLKLLNDYLTARSETPVKLGPRPTRRPR